MDLLDRIQRDELLQVLGAYDAISARMAEQAGAEAVYMSGAAVATSLTGEPDVGLTTMTEMARRAHEMVSPLTVPLVADADTGYGNPLNVCRTVQEYERAGVSAIQIEDQTFPKKCGHFEGKEVIPAAEFAAKVEAALDARVSDDFLVIARTDALAAEGVDEAIRRGRLYAEAGADVLFVESPTTREQMERVVDAVPGPHLANMAVGGKTPILPAEELEAIGYDLAIYPTPGFKAALEVYRHVYETIRSDGTPEAMIDDMIDWDLRNEITGLDRIDELEDRYAAAEQRYGESEHRG